MTADIGYRGPDGVGHWAASEGGVALGHRRLSIIDLSADAAQPMLSADGRYVIVFNGEIYNYLEIRRELQATGHAFRTDSDTEVLIAAYAKWGEQCLDRLVGMYAFTIWDRRERELFAARDRMGIKPFYFRVEGTRLIFGSEIKSLLAVQSEPRSVDTALVGAYLTFGYVPGDVTLHAGVRRLLPGHRLRWRNGRADIREYWDYRLDRPRRESLEESAARVTAVLEESIALHLRSDVPVGVFLSGGLDSSTVVSLLAPGASAGLKTFSVAWDLGPRYDETAYAREVARLYRTDHHEVQMTPRDFLDFLPRFVWHMDEPVADSAALSLYRVSRLARESVTVCLSGEGSDELFAGYDFYAYNLAMERARAVLGGGVLGALRHLVPFGGRAAKLRKYLMLASLPFEERYRGTSTSDTPKISALVGGESRLRRADPRVAGFVEGLFSRTRTFDPLSRMLYFDTKTWLVDDLLTKADRMSMAASIELRVPFLDHRVVECAATIASVHKLKGREVKRVLKAAVRNRLPASIVARRKQGFPTPLKLMFRGELYEYARDLLTSAAATGRGYFEPVAVRRLLEEHRSGRASNEREIWQLMVLEEWHRQFLL